MGKSWLGSRRVRLALIVAVFCTYGPKLVYGAQPKLPNDMATEMLSQKHRVIVRYHVDKTAGGLVNQMLCHIGAFLLAIPLRAEILLPSALSRSTFNTKWWQQEWYPEPLPSLLDVEGIIRHWRKRGIVIHQSEETLNSNMGMSAPASQGEYTSGINVSTPENIVRFEFEGQGLHLAEIVAQAQAVLKRHKGGNMALNITILDLGVINSEHFPYNLTGCQQLTGQVVEGLLFAPSIKVLAREVVERMASVGRLGGYNGLHLRFEADALSAWAWEQSAQQLSTNIASNLPTQVLWDGYVDGMKRATFSADTDLYIASGLEASSAEFQQLSIRLQNGGLCREVLHKDKFLPKRILAGLHSEQKALIDLLVLVQSKRYVGTLRSSFSCYTRDLRNLRKKSSSSSVVIKVGDFPPSILPFQELIPSSA